MTITKEYKHSWNYSWKHMFSRRQRYSMYAVMVLWAIWGASGFALLTYNATIQGYAFAKEVWADYQNPETTYEKTIVITEKDPVKVLEDGNYRVVERIIDGDTLVMENGERVRLIGVDTPETKHPQ